MVEGMYINQHINIHAIRARSYRGRIGGGGENKVKKRGVCIIQRIECLFKVMKSLNKVVSSFTVVLENVYF